MKNYPLLCASSLQSFFSTLVDVDATIKGWLETSNLTPHKASNNATTLSRGFCIYELIVSGGITILLMIV